MIWVGTVDSRCADKCAVVVYISSGTVMCGVEMGDDITKGILLRGYY